ncbi:EamA family transporter [archaeon]|nr:EamA family transporter [archaeon]
MELWLIIGILGFASSAISTSIDKYMMNHKYGAIKTNALKMFLDGVILLTIGLLFFNIEITSSLILWSLILGSLYAAAGILYFESLEITDVEEVMPFSNASTTLLIFIGSIIFLGETANLGNYIGIILTVIGIYLVLLTNGLKYPKIDKGFYLMIKMVIFTVIYSLLIKTTLTEIKPINIAITMYFSTTLFLVSYLVITKKESLSFHNEFKKHIPKIALSSFFGASATFLIFFALSIGKASKVYPLAGLQSVFILIIATIFLKEKITIKRILGTIIIFAGIYFITI